MAGLKNLLQGKPLRAPLHPAIVHLPIALFVLATVIDIASWIVADSTATLVRAAFTSLVIGLITGAIAVITGLADYSAIREDHPGRKTATTHLRLNLVAIGLFAISTGVRYGTPTESRTPALPLIVSLVALGVLSYSGYLGGRLVYDDGIAVGRHRRIAPLPHSTIKITTNGKPTVVADENAIAEGGTLRVDVDGIVATVMRTKETIHAFQEFCTHRYGPLSEGTFRGCEVICPWHQSKFDMRTGKVTGGPAKIDLRIFRAEIRDGKIWIHPPSSAAS